MIRLFAAMLFLILSLTAVNAAQSASRAKAELSSAAVNSAAQAIPDGLCRLQCWDEYHNKIKGAVTRFGF
jgi:hypothetical protein